MKDNLRKYAEISCRNVEWDCLDVVPELMVSWLSVPGVLQSLAKHWSSGELLSPAQVSNIQEAKVHLIIIIIIGVQHPGGQGPSGRV